MEAVGSEQVNVSENPASISGEVKSSVIVNDASDVHPFPGLVVVTVHVPDEAVNSSNGSLIQVNSAPSGPAHEKEASSSSFSSAIKIVSVAQLITGLDGNNAD